MTITQGITKNAEERNHLKRFLALFTLSFWQIQQIKFVFILAMMGMLAAIVLVSALPLFTAVNTTASARAAFTNQPYDPSSSVQINIKQAVQSAFITEMIQQVKQDYQHNGAPFFDLAPDLSLHLDNNSVYFGNSLLPLSNQVVEVHGYDITHIASHLQVLQGRLPQMHSNGGATMLEVAMSANNAAALNAHIGSTYTISIVENPVLTSLSQNTSMFHIPVTLQVVGIFHDQSDAAFDTAFWHGDSLNYQPPWDIGPAHENVVTSNAALLTLFDQLATQSQEATLTSTATISLSFPLDIHAITNENRNQLQKRLDYLTNQEPGQLLTNFVDTITIINVNLTTMNNGIGNQTSVMQIPLLVVVGLMLGLILFFVTLMTDLLVMRQAEAISIMRSRGATMRQIFCAFVLQSLLLTSLAIVLGSLLVSPVVRILITTQHISSLQNALDVLPNTPWQVLSVVGWYLWVTVAIAVLTMSLAIWRSLKSSLLGRSSQQTVGLQRPFWQRFYFDLIFALLGILLFLLYLYISSSSAFTLQVQVLLAGPCMLVAATFFCLAAVFLFLRLFPWLLQVATQLLARGSGIVPLFAFIVLARTPRQALRTILLLVFTIAFALFAQVLLATQLQRTVAVANYVTSADFSGSLLAENTGNGSLEQQEQRYQQIPGVFSAALGYVHDESFLNTYTTLTVIATDPARFGRSMNWSPDDNQEQVKSLLARLADQRKALATEEVNAQVYRPLTPLPLPAIVSAATKNALHLSPGTIFFLNGTDENAQMPLVDIGELPSLPGVPAITQDLGVLVDYHSFSFAYNASIQQGAALSPTTAWLHTRTDPASVSAIQQTLGSGSLTLLPLTSRQGVLKKLQNDPLFVNMLYACTLGILLTLILAAIGCLISTWLSLRARLRSLLTLRALGITPMQLTLLLSWEQVIIYGIALLLGIGCGVGFTRFALPGMVFSNTASLGTVITTFTTDIFQLQSTPPLQMIIPFSLVIELAIVVLFCLAGIAMTVTIVMRLSPAQMLRLSEDYLEEAPLFPTTRTKSVPIEHEHASFWENMQLGLSLTPVRSIWPLVGLSQLGILVSVLFVCVVPLFSQVATTAGLHDVLIRPENRYVTTTSSFDSVSLQRMQPAITQATQSIQRALSGPTASYFSAAPIVSLNDIHILSKNSAAPALTFDGLSQQNLHSQVQILQGHIPQATGKFLQVMLTSQAANYLHVQVGATLTQAQGYPLAMQVVGLFRALRTNDTLLPTTDFFVYSDLKNHASGVVTALTTTEGLQAAVTGMATSRSYTLSGSVIWRYPLHESVPGTQLNDLVSTLSSLHLAPGSLSHGTLVLSPMQVPLDALQQYQQSVLIASIPISCISVLIIVLLLLFLNFMVDLLVGREASAIATMRSRGATSSQIFFAFFARTFFLNAIVLVVGMILAIPAVILLTRLTLQPGDQSGLRLFTDHPLQTFWTLLQYTFVSAVVIQLTMSLTLMFAIRTNPLVLRQEVGRIRRKPFWQRLYLDGIGSMIVLVASIFSLYLTKTDLFGSQINVLVKAPLVLTATIFLIVTCALLFLRLFPLLLRVVTQLALRHRGVAPMLAFSSLVRAPRQSVRTLFLLMVTSAFVVFLVIFSASQNQHVTDVAHYWTGADFSGSFPTPLPLAQAGRVQQAYQHVQGMSSVTLGDVETLTTLSGETDVTMIAVDPYRFVHTINWSEIGTRAQQQTLIAKLQDPLQFPDLQAAWISAPDNSLPALVDAHIWQTLQLTPGQTFFLHGPQGSISIFAVQQVNSIPTVHSQGQNAQAGILVDVQHYHLVYQALASQATPPGQNVQVNDITLNTAWLKTDGRMQSLQRVRQSVETGPLQLAAFYDRQAIAQNLMGDPLSRNLAGILMLGTLAPLLLAWIGCLLAFWMDIRQRQVLFGVLRALGSTPGQLARIVGCEQALIFGVAIPLGVAFGILTAFLALPSLVLTSVFPHLSVSISVNETQDLFSLQNIPPVQTIVPGEVVSVVALLLVLGLLTVVLMVKSAGRLALAQTLRIDED